LCFKCAEPYTFGHKCKGKNLMLIECDDIEDEEGEEATEKEETTLAQNLKRSK